MDDINAITELTPQQSQDVNFVLDFARTMQNYNPYLFNPLLSNQFLKDVNMNSAQYTHAQVVSMVNRPRDNEKALKGLSQYLYDSQMSYKRMTHYLADILTFDHYPIPINATEEDMDSKSFKRDYDAVCKWFTKFNVQKEFRKAMLKMVDEDGYFTYLREDEDGDLFLQEMPIDWCLIDSSWKYGYLYSFNLMYFHQSGADISGYPEEFKTMYNNALDMAKNKTYYPNIRPEMRNGNWAYWHQLPPKNAWVFKFHNHFAGLVPPFLGVFLDFIDLPALKDLQNAKSELEAYKIIMGTVPRNKDDKSGNSKDNFAISAESLANFVQLVKSSLQNKYVDFKAVPLENLEMFSFEDSADKTDVVAKALNNISSQSGIDKALLNTDRPNIATMNLSKLIDSAFISRLYDQFADFCTYHANLQTKKFKFKIVFEGTIHDREERIDRYMSYADKGIVLAPQMASAIGMSVKEMTDSMAMSKHVNFFDNIKLLPTAFTQSSKSPGGRPRKKEGELEDAGEQTRTIGANEEREVDG